MGKQTKLILSVLGLAAVVVPAVLLIVLTARTKPAVKPPTTSREIDARNVEETVKRQITVPSPSAASPSASPAEATGSSQ